MAAHELDQCVVEQGWLRVVGGDAAEGGIEGGALGCRDLRHEGPEQLGALDELDVDVEAGGELDLGGRPPRADPVEPAIDAEVPLAEGGWPEAALPAVVAE